MKSKETILGLLSALTLLLGACTIGQAPPSGDPVQAAATIVAKTLAAQGVSTAAGQATTAAPSLEAVTPSSTAKPTFKISVNGSECRSGIGDQTDLVSTLDANTEVDLIARNTADGYWLVKDPNSGSSCWIQAQSGSPSGDFQGLPELTPQAPVANEAPAAPSWAATSDAWQYTCAPGVITVSLQWTDRADNETGYRVYRNGEVIAELPAGTTFYSDQVNVFGGTFAYSIRAYNAVGESGSLSTSAFSC